MAGRVVDADGWPVNQAAVEVTLLNVKGLTFKPLKVGTNCFGDFAGYFDVGELAGSRAVVKATIRPPEGETIEGAREVSVEAPADFLFRRSDLVIKLPYSWQSECPPAQGFPPYRSLWLGRATVWGRAVNGTGEQDRNGVNVWADPWENTTVLVRLDFEDGREPFGPSFPPDQPDPEERTNERGDFKYSWVFDSNVTQAKITVAMKGKTYETTYDPFARIAFVKINTGEDMPRGTPAVPLLLVAAAVALAAILATAVVDRRRR